MTASLSRDELRDRRFRQLSDLQQLRNRVERPLFKRLKLNAATPFKWIEAIDAIVRKWFGGSSNEYHVVQMFVSFRDMI